MKMKAYIILMINLAVSSTDSIGHLPTKAELMDIGEEKSITEVNMDLGDDIITQVSNMHRSDVIHRSSLWKPPIPYVLDKSLDLNAKGVILKAFEQFRLKSCIDFKLRSSEINYIVVQKLKGCFSYLGKVMKNGQQLSIGEGCDSLSTVEHEFFHALGFNHEHARYDRDNYITILKRNIKKGFIGNFKKKNKQLSTTNNIPYDYWSVMHYSKNAFNNGKGSTIITKDSKFQDLIGQRMEMSDSDVLELNLLYRCDSTVSFKMYCDFSDRNICEMNHCSQSGNGWEAVTQVAGGPSSDQTGLPSKGHSGKKGGFFMHASTASGQKGNSARLESNIMRCQRECNVQCLMFYYYHSGNESDQLNIWIREFTDTQDANGTFRLMGQITGSPTSHWKLHHVSLNAAKLFQVVFEVRKGSGTSYGGFSIDDINLSETECPDLVFQVENFENLLAKLAHGTPLYSPRHYSKDGYAYRTVIVFHKTNFGMYIQLLSGANDSRLEWPCVQRQLTFEMLDQNPNIQKQMSMQRSFITQMGQTTPHGIPFWDDPGKTKVYSFLDENKERVYAGPFVGSTSLFNMKHLQYRDFLKGGRAVFILNFKDLTPLVNGSSLPCPKMKLEIPQYQTSIGIPDICASRTTSFGFPTTSVISPVFIFILALMVLVL